METKARLRLIIVGGVAGGMSAATRARRLDETAIITVFEKGSYVSFANCGLPYALGGIIKDDAALILQTPKAFKERFNIDFHDNSEVMSIDPVKKTVQVKMPGSKSTSEYPYDKLILSQGAEPFRPPIDGVDSQNVFTLQTIPDLQNIKAYIARHEVQTIAVIGGGFIGIETADALHDMGLQISPSPSTKTSDKTASISFSTPEYKPSCPQAKNNQGHVLLAQGAPVPADLVILSVGIRARTALAQQAGLTIGKTGVQVNELMQTSDPSIYAVGDMVEIAHKIAERRLNTALAGPANRQGRLVADNIFGHRIAYRGNLGTSVCKVFGLTVASTGLAVHTLTSMGTRPQWVTVHPPDHASYYPGSYALTLKVVFEPVTGKILGAQAVGIAGVDKRIDVLSTAMQANFTIFDLEHLELAYAPPYSSAKDPVNMAGFVGANVLRGDVEIVHPSDLNMADLTCGGTQIVDVRSAGEYARGHIKDAVNLPVNELRSCWWS